MKETEFELRAWLQPLPNGQPPRKLSALGVRLSRLTLPYMELDLSYDNDRSDWGFFALACFRASIVGHAATFFLEDFPLQTIHDAINFLPDEEGYPCVSTLKFGLKALTQTDMSFEQLIHALASCGEVSDPLLEVTYGLNSYVERLGESVAEVLSVIHSYDGSFHNSHADRFLNELEEISTSASWVFWRDWYTSFQDGRPFSWELQRRVALIDDAIWEAGPEGVAAEIERIKAEFLAEKLPMAETIELNPETGKFRAIPIPVENPSYMSALLSQIGDALEDCLGGHNGLSDASGDVKKLNRVLTKYRDDPQNAELTLTRVAGSLRGQLHDSRELPDNEDNLALLNAVEEGVRGIRANHSEVAENREQLARQAFKTLATEEKQVLEEALPILTAISEAELAEDFSQDIPELINDATLPLANGAPPLPGADAATRVFSRISKIALLKAQYDQVTRKGAEWFDSDTRKTVQLACLVGGGAIAAGVNFGPKLLELVQIGLRLLGVL
ncbi:hypothetical protein [Phaeobacter gallaeciensis]|uniref:hypothetical protein n=1 Tax=Phaeobacter gallaeciensis TaxID=60890 RepID=UPI000BC032E8|nr:hypothetical protein [Phaeobacter gallaeciensis]ATF17675.1 hypothetical protein PhaeoP129_01029 [Phaeobacter gallaeciensis]ATF21784.1 hypothetical protein PhaeoP128_01029 [Phaeobacter gallaeciensis]